MPDSSDHSRDVLVVYGRNERARRAMFQFLRSLDLNPLEWTALVNDTASGAPYVGEVLNTAFSRAQAVIALFTPDDEARLKPEFWSAADDDREKQFSGQPRQNVLFESGMALSSHPDQTILVALGHVRILSDVLGRHLLRMDGSIQSRRDIVNRLRQAKCRLVDTGTDWHTEGDFTSAIAGDALLSTGQEEPETAPRPDETPTNSSDVSSLGTGDTSKSIDSVKKPKLPSPTEFLRLGEHLWFLSNPSDRLTQTELVTVIRGFLEILDRCGLKATRASAKPLEAIEVHYHVATNLVVPASRELLKARMEILRSSLEDELQKIFPEQDRK